MKTLLKSLLVSSLLLLLAGACSPVEEPRTADRFVGVKCLSVTKSYTDAFGPDGVTELNKAINKWSDYNAPHFTVEEHCPNVISVGHVKLKNAIGVERSFFKVGDLVVAGEIVIDETKLDQIVLGPECKGHQVYLYSLLLHEIGHLHGLGHLPSPEAVMYPYLQPCLAKEPTGQEASLLHGTYRYPIQWPWDRD